MTCSEATGACDTIPDGLCISPKESGYLDPIGNVFIQGVIDGFEVTWDVTSHPTETVTMLYKEEGSGVVYEAIIHVNRDTGLLATPPTLDSSKTYQCWLRPENATEFGAWQMFIAIADPDWNSKIRYVTYKGEAVFYKTQVVTITL